MKEVGARLIERIPNQILISIDLKRWPFRCRTALLCTAEMRPYENPWPYNVKTVFNKYLGNGRSN